MTRDEFKKTLLAGRHPSTQLAMRWFEYDHLPAGDIRATSMSCEALAVEMVQRLKDSPELTAGLRKLREAKDCFVFQAVLDSEDS